MSGWGTVWWWSELALGMQEGELASVLEFVQVGGAGD